MGGGLRDKAAFEWSFDGSVTTLVGDEERTFEDVRRGGGESMISEARAV